MIRSRALRLSGGRLAAAVVLAMVVLLAAAGSAFAGPTPPIPSIPITPIFPPWVSGWLTSSLPATVTGTVRSVGGANIAGALVEVSGDTDSLAIEAQSFRQTAITDASGRFVIPDVIQGNYSMVINDPDASPTVPAFRETYPWYNWADWGLGGADTRHWIVGGTTVDVGVITLSATGHVQGRALLGGSTPVANSEVIADITNGDEHYRRDVMTGADGRFDIANAPAGDWSVTYSGSGAAVPNDAGPPPIHSYDAPVVTESEAATFTLTSGATHNMGNEPFQSGCQVQCNSWETFNSYSYQLSNIDVSLTSEADPSIVYYWGTDDTGHASRYVPPGSYTMVYHDSLGLYADLDTGAFVAASGGTANMARQMFPAPNTYAVYGNVTEAGTGANVESWVSEALVDPSGWAWPSRRVWCTGSGPYLIRVPAVTGFAGNQVRIDVDDKTGDVYPGTNHPDGPTHVTNSFTTAGPADVNHNFSLAVGGKITGTVHDEAGNPVRGVSVSAERRAISPDVGTLAWMNSALPSSDSWWTITDSSGHYTLGGLPADSDYKVVFNPDYNPPPWPMPIKYQAYYRQVWHNRPVLDSLNTAVFPPATDHDPVAVTVGATHSSVDATIMPGGYVGLHANGPLYPTGAVYSDVMYQVGSTWAEVDSGFSTGGTFEKLRKVLPTGHYRLDYSDYFGRGAGSWEFDLAGGEHKYASVVVPMPMVYLSSSATAVLGSFDGLLDGGLIGGGVGSAKLNVDKLASLPATAPPPPANYISGGGIYAVSLAGTSTADGVWTLTLPYNPAIPDNLVGSLRVRHLKMDGTAEILMPFRWNTAKHTLQVQTTSLSPFQVMFKRAKVALGRPSVPRKIKRNKRFTVTGMLTPRHGAGAKSVRMYAYKYSSSKRRYLLVSKPWAKNATYRGATRFSVSLKLGKGKYRLTPVAPADTWHLATTGPYKAITIK